MQALPDVLLDNNHYQQQQRASDTAAAGGPLPLHYVELRAPSSIMPWTLHRLLELLQVGWAGLSMLDLCQPHHSASHHFLQSSGTIVDW